MPGRRGCLGCLGGCFTKVLLVLVVGTAVVWGVEAAMNPWALHIGSRSTPPMCWHGTGPVVSKDGKKYPLYVVFAPGKPGGTSLPREGKRWSANLTGVGRLCVAPGTPERMRVTGTMYGGYSGSADSLFAFRLNEWPNVLVINSNGGFFDLAGMWHGQELVMDRPNEQGLTFKSGVLIDHATVTLHWADEAEFDAACGSGK